MARYSPNSVSVETLVPACGLLSVNPITMKAESQCRLLAAADEARADGLSVNGFMPNAYTVPATNSVGGMMVRGAVTDFGTVETLVGPLWREPRPRFPFPFDSAIEGGL